MASKKRRAHHPVRAIILCLLLVCILAAAALAGMITGKVKKLQQGASFDFAYTVTSTSAQTPTLYAVLEQADATRGDLYGVYAPGQLLLSLYQLSGTEAAATWDAATGEVTLHPDARAAEPFTRVYIDSTETLYDVGQLYKTARQAIVDAYPLADMLLPAWSLGNYISQTQLATLLGVDTGTVEMQDMAGFSLSLRALTPTTPADALDGYVYFQLANMASEDGTASADAPVLVLGVPKTALFADTIPLHILLTIPQHGVQVELLGTLSAAESTIVAPSSRMQDEDIAALAQVRQTVEDIVQFVQQAAGSASK